MTACREDTATVKRGKNDVIHGNASGGDGSARQPVAFEKGLDVFLFEVAGQRYALRSLDVREVVRAVTMVPLPKAPPIVEGIIDVRGTVVPVLDIRTRFRLPAKPAAHTDHLIIAWAGHRLVALRADRALGLVQIDAGTVEIRKKS